MKKYIIIVLVVILLFFFIIRISTKKDLNEETWYTESQSETSVVDSPWPSF